MLAVRRQIPTNPHERMRASASMYKPCSQALDIGKCIYPHVHASPPTTAYVRRTRFVFLVFFSRMMVFRVSTGRCSSRSSLCSEDLCMKITGNICMVPSLVRSVIKAMQEWLLSERIATFDFSALCTTSATLVGPSMYYIVLSALRICWRYEKQKIGGKTPLKESISRSTSAIQHHFSLCLSTKNPGLLWGCSLPTTVSWS